MSTYNNQNESTYKAESAKIPLNQNESELVDIDNSTPETHLDENTGLRVPNKSNLLRAAGFATPNTHIDEETGFRVPTKNSATGDQADGTSQNALSASTPVNQNQSELSADNYKWWEKFRQGCITANSHLNTKHGMGYLKEAAGLFGLDLTNVTSLNTWLKMITGGHGAGYLMNKSEITNEELISYVVHLANSGHALSRIPLDIAYRELIRLRNKGKVPGTQQWTTQQNTLKLKGEDSTLGKLGSIVNAIAGADPHYSSIELLRYSIDNGAIYEVFDTLHKVIKDHTFADSEETGGNRPWISDYRRMRDFEMSDPYYWGVSIQRFSPGDGIDCLLPPLDQVDTKSKIQGSDSSGSKKKKNKLWSALTGSGKYDLFGEDKDTTAGIIADDISYENGWWPVISVSFTKNSLKGKTLNVPDFELNIPFATDYPKDLSITIVDDAKRTFRSWLDTYSQLVYNKYDRTIIPYKHLLFKVEVYNYDCTYSILNKKTLLCIISDYTNPFISSESHTSDEIEITMEIVGEIIDSSKDSSYTRGATPQNDTGEIVQSGWVKESKK